MCAFIVFVYVFLVAFVLYWYISYKKNDLMLKIPMAPAYPIIGHILYFKQSDVLTKAIKTFGQYGRTLKFKGFGCHLVVFCNYKYVEEVLSTTKLLQKSEEYLFLRKWLGTGLLTAEPEKWFKTRRILTPAFHFEILEQFVDVFNSCGDILIKLLKKEVGKESVDVYPYVTLCTLDIICESAMGTSINAQENSTLPYVQSVQELNKIIANRFFNYLKQLEFSYRFTRDYTKEKNALKIVHGFTNRVIKTRKEELQRRNNIGLKNASKRKTRMAFLDLLLNSQIDGRALTDSEIREEVDTFMFEGHDTTASALAFTLYELSINPSIQERVVEELREIFTDKTAPVTYLDLKRMTYVEMVIKEAMRLYPPVPYFGRYVSRDTELSDFTLPKGIRIAVVPYVLHRDPEVFPNPEKFDPERFTLENQNSRNPFSYIPFSGGPRNCIGQRFAMMELKSTISKILRNFELRAVHGFVLQLAAEPILRTDNGMEICLKERDF